MRNSNRASIRFALLFCSALLAVPAMAAWQVDNQNSEFHFVTTKAGKPGVAAVQEIQTFKKISGQVNDSGRVQFQIDLASVDTGVEVRDQRIKELLFDVINNPQATFDGKVNMAAIKKLAPGSITNLDLDGTITISKVSKPVVAKLRVVKLTGNKLLVETRAPFIINAADFGIQAGVDAMLKVMGLNVLSSAVPVNFSIVLK